MLVLDFITLYQNPIQSNNVGVKNNPLTSQHSAHHFAQEYVYI